MTSAALYRSMDIPHSREHYKIVKEKRACALMFQTADEDAKITESGFRIIYSTLRF